MGSLVRHKLALSIAFVGMGSLVTGGYLMMQPTPVKASDEPRTVVMRQSGGPLGIVRGQSAQFSILVPAV